MALTLAPEDRRIMVAEYIDKAERSLADAKKTIDIPSACSIMSYTAAFHASHALLVSDGLETTRGRLTHKGLHGRIAEIYVRGEGVIPKAISDYLEKMETDRDEAMYDRKRKVSRENAANGLARAEEYLALVKAIIPERLERTIRRQSGDHTSEEAAALKREKEIAAIIAEVNGPQKSEPKVYTDAASIPPRQGRIIYTSYCKGFSIQQIGDVSFVCHEHDRLDRIPERGEVVIIRYDDAGRGTVER